MGEPGALGGLRLPGAEPLDLAPGGHAEVPVAVAAAQPVVLPGGAEPVAAVLAQGVEHPEADAEAALLPHHHGFADQLADQVQHLLRVDAVAGADVLGGLEIEAAGEDGEASPEQTFLQRAEFVTPADCGAQGLMPQQGAAGAAGQQAEAVVEAEGDLLHRERAQAARGQLHGQRDAVQATAEQCHLLGVPLGQLEAGQHRRRAVGEERHGVRRAAPGRRGDGQRGDRQQVLAGRLQGLPAGGQDPQARCRPQQRVDQLGAGLHQVLAAVQHDQQLPVGELLHQHVQRRSRGRVGQAQGFEYGVPEQHRLLDGGHLDQPDAVGEAAVGLGGGPQGEPALAHPAGPVTVTSLDLTSSRASVASSSRRPMKLLTSAGSRTAFAGCGPGSASCRPDAADSLDTVAPVALRPETLVRPVGTGPIGPTS